jgi:hypothetical protein
MDEPETIVRAGSSTLAESGAAGEWRVGVWEGSRGLAVCRAAWLPLEHPAARSASAARASNGLTSI